MKKRKKQTKKSPFNDLLLPILLIILVMPFIVRLYEYDCGYGSYEWHSNNAIQQDLYCVYRSYFFILVTWISLVILVGYKLIYKKKEINVKFLFPLIIYGFFVFLSTTFSTNINASIKGNYYQFESLFVIVGYIIIFIYCYLFLQTEKDIQCVFLGFLLLISLEGIVGLLQACQINIFNFQEIQKFILPKKYEAQYLGTLFSVFSGNNVSLTMFNPNYAGQFLAMMEMLLLAYIPFEKNKKCRALLIVMSIMVILLLWFCYSRGALLSLSGGVILYFYLLIRCGRLQINIHKILGGLAILSVLLILIDSTQNFHFIKRLVDRKVNSGLEEIVTEADGIHITYNQKKYQLEFFKNEYSIKKEKKIISDYPFQIDVFEIMETDGVLLTVDEMEFIFINIDGTYYYLNQNGKITTLNSIPKIDFKGYENWGSGRVYIWSRILPLLQNYIFLGSGPDTFAEVFPQNDYVGKALYCKDSTMIIEKAHNMYLSMWVQNGMIALFAFLYFIIVFLKTSWKWYCSNCMGKKVTGIGMGAYLACIVYLIDGFFNDLNLFATPIFWILAGVNLAVIHRQMNEGR